MTGQTQSPVADVRWLGKRLFVHRWSAVGAVLCGMVGGITASLEPFIIGLMINRLSQPEQIGAQLRFMTPPPFTADLFIAHNQATLIADLTGLIMLMIGLAVITVIAFYGQRRYSGTIAYGVNFDIRKQLFENMLTLEQGFYQKYPTGDLISRMHADITLIWQLFALGFTRIGSAITTVIAVFILLAIESLPLTILVFVVLTISTSIQMRVGLVIAPLFEKVQDQAGVMAGLVQDAVSGIQTIKTAGKEAGVGDTFYRENKEYRHRWLFFKRRNEPIGLLPNMISETTAAIVVLAGGVMTLNGTLSLGSFTSFLLYLAMISTVLLQIGTVYQRYQQTRGALTRLTPLLQHATISSKDSAQTVDRVNGAITFEGVSVRFDDTELLKSISLHIPAGKRSRSSALPDAENRSS